MDTTELRASMLDSIEEMKAEITRMETAVRELDGHAEPSPRRQARAAKPKPAVVPLGKLIQVITRQPGLTTTTIAKDTGGDQTAILGLLKEAEADGTVRREGERRATRWFVI